MLVALVFLSAGGLLAGGFIGLWRSAQSAQNSARISAERAAYLAARTIHLMARDPQLVERRRQLHVGDEFEVRGGRLVVPDGYASRIEPPSELGVELHPEEPRLDLRDEVVAARDAAQVASASGDPPAAAAKITAALEASRGSSPRKLGYVLQIAAWEAYRRADLVQCEQHVAALARQLDLGAAATEPPYRSVVAAYLLLCAKLGRWPEESPSAEAALAALAPLQRELVVERLREIFGTRATAAAESAGPFVADLTSLAALVERRHHVLAVVAPQIERWLTSSGPVVEPLAGEILVYHPNDAESGVGLLLPPRELLVGTAESEVSDGSHFLTDDQLTPGGGARVLFGDSLPADAMVAAPGIGVLPVELPQEELLASPGAIAALLTLLAGALVTALLLALRTLRREAALTRARADFLTSITHELKTPLAGIRLFAEMLLEGRVASEEKRHEYHRLLAGESERLSALIENVLDLGRLERGERALTLEERDVVEIVREVIERFEPLAERDGLELHALLPSAPLLGRVDRGALAQIVLNLLDNARKYARDGRRIEVELRDGGSTSNSAESTNPLVNPASARISHLRLDVRDFGPGVPDAERAAIFEPFVRGARQHDGALPGVGLGLHLARSLARAQGGDLVLAPPTAGEAGARFVVTLPRLIGRTT